MNFAEEICAWYDENKRVLDWRMTKDPYKIWLSEVILQQTQVKQATPYYRKLIEAFPSVFALAEAHEDSVLKLWQGLGYYSRARNLHTTAKAIAFQYNGVFPNTYDDLITLKGIGDYTASAIASFCFGEARPVVDGNVYRVLARFFGISTPINSSEGSKIFKALAYKVMDSSRIDDYNQAIMEFGAIQCKPKSPNCQKCPLAANCVAFYYQKTDIYPIKIKSKPIKKRYFNYLVFRDQHNYTLLKQRKNKDIWHNLYEFPLIETSTRTNKENIIDGLETFIGALSFLKIEQYNADAVHKLSHQHLHTTFWEILVKEDLKHGVCISELRKFAVPILISNFIEKHLS